MQVTGYCVKLESRNVEMREHLRKKKRQKIEGGARLNQFSAEKWNRNVRLVFVYRL